MFKSNEINISIISVLSLKMPEELAVLNGHNSKEDLYNDSLYLLIGQMFENTSFISTKVLIKEQKNQHVIRRTQWLKCKPNKLIL